MEDIYIDVFSKPIDDREIFDIKIENNTDEELIYKVIIGREGVWEALDDDFIEKNEFEWAPRKKGNYHIIAQAKRKDSIKSFDYKTSRGLAVGVDKENLIKDLSINKGIFDIGDKIDLMVESNKIPVMYRYFISSKDGWRLIRDYTPDNTLKYTANEAGKFEILIECKEPDSDNNFDDYSTITFAVNNVENVEIVDFKCLAGELLIGEELIFKVDANFEDSRTGLYKFVKVTPDGSVYCVQDYSSRNMVTFTEDKAGEFKLMCYIRDMYSAKEYDDRALMTYKIKPYRDLKLKSLTTDLNSPERIGENVNIKAVITGGKDVRYRFNIEGPHSEDSGFKRSNSFMWNTKLKGDYKINLYAKDESFKGEHELHYSINFSVEEDKQKPVRITNIDVNNEKINLVEKPIKIVVSADGGDSLKYSFVISKNGKPVHTSEYEDRNWTEFTPTKAGAYDLEIKVKDKYSDKKYDTESVISIDVKAYKEAKIDHVLVPAKDYFLVGDEVDIEAIVQDTNEILMKYVTTINGQIVEETDYDRVKKLSVTPKCPGKYVIEMYVKNKKCMVGFDAKRDVKFYVNEAPPVTNTKVTTNKKLFKINDEISFNCTSDGGKGICYEFYMMKNGSWNLTQRYSRKKYYVFRPFASGDYRVLVLAKSHYRKCAYEDYGVLEFEVK